MKFFRELPIAGPLMVALFGPITYLEGENLDAVIIVDYFLLDFDHFSLDSFISLIQDNFSTIR